MVISRKFLKFFGWCLLVGALIWILPNLVQTALFPNESTSDITNHTWQLMQQISSGGIAILLICFFVVPIRLYPHSPVFAIAGYLVMALGGAILTGISIAACTILPTFAPVAPELFINGPAAMNTTYNIGAILLGLGGVIIAIEIWRTKTFSRYSAYLIFAGILVIGASNPFLETTNTYVSTLSYCLFAAGVGIVGYQTATFPSLDRAANL